jgi:hypothetical protein
LPTQFAGGPQNAWALDVAFRNRLVGLIRNQPIEAVDNDELNLALLSLEIQTELLPESGKDRIRKAFRSR